MRFFRLALIHCSLPKDGICFIRLELTFIQIFIRFGILFFSPRFTKVTKLLLLGREVEEQQNLWKQILMKYDDGVMCLKSGLKGI